MGALPTVETGPPTAELVGLGPDTAVTCGPPGLFPPRTPTIVDGVAPGSLNSGRPLSGEKPDGAGGCVKLKVASGSAKFSIFKKNPGGPPPGTLTSGCAPVFGPVAYPPPLEAPPIGSPAMDVPVHVSGFGAETGLVDPGDPTSDGVPELPIVIPDRSSRGGEKVWDRLHADT